MTDGVRRLTHEEAEMLISARMDEQLDRADSRALLVHLQTCESCRAFAVQAEVLGRGLAALPVLPPSPVVDRQIRESIRNGRSRWSLGALLPVTGGNGGLRVAVGALAMLTLVSVFLLVRMAGDQGGNGPSIDAPNGGLAQQLELTPTSDSALVAAPTETPRVVVPKTPENTATEHSGAIGSTEIAIDPTEPAGGQSNAAQIEPTKTLDPNFVYPITKSPTTTSSQQDTTEPGGVGGAEPTEDSGNVAVAAVLAAGESPEAASEEAETPAPESPVSESPKSTPSETEDVTPEPTVTPIPTTEEPPAAPTETEVRVEESPTEEPPTNTPEPTSTPTPIEISVEPTEPTVDPTVEAATMVPEESISVDTQEGEPSPSASEETPSDLEPTDTPVPPTPTETSEPFVQPTIAPLGGQTSVEQGTGDSPPIVPNDGTAIFGDESGSGEAIGAAGIEAQTDLPTDETDDGTGGSPPIVPSDGTGIPEGVGSAGNPTESGESAGVASAIPTVDESIEPMGLDLSDTVTGLPAGTSNPVGRLEFSPGMDLYVVTAPDGQLAVANLDGELVVTLGAGDVPVWSGGAVMFRMPGEFGSQVGIWDSATGNIAVVPASENEASNDVPIGGDGISFYFLRSYPDSGIVEIRSTTVDGGESTVLWTSDAVTLASDRPLYSESGVYLPTESEWLFIDWSGGESSLGANPYGYIGSPVLSPGGGLMAYSVGDEVVVAWTEAPGEANATAPFNAPGGYAFATSGEEIVVSDGSSLHVISYQGEDLGSLAGTRPIGAVYWISDTIYFLQIGEDAALQSTSLAAIQGA
jgi:hypothetical protein